MKTLGVIGLGSIGMRHAKNLQDLGHEVLVFDPNINNIPHPFMINETLPDLLDNSDALIIASPTPSHFDDIWRSHHHKKPAFVEKPIADRLCDAIEYVTMVGYNLRFHGCVKIVKDWMPLVGKPIRAQFDLLQYNAKPPYLRDGVILNWSHEIDLALYLLGPAEVKSSKTKLTDGYDSETWIRLAHDNKCRTEIHLDYVTDPEVRKFTIVGYDGIITCDLAGRSCWITYDDGTEATFQGKDTWNDNYVEEMQAFIDRIDGKETIGCTGAEALEVLKICLEVRKQAGLK